MQGQNSAAVFDKIQKYSAHHYKHSPVVPVRGLGVRVWDIEGREYIDMHSSYSVHNFGHNHPRLIEAMTAQAKKLCVMSLAFPTDVYADFAEALARFCYLKRVMPANDGVGAVEAAIKIARKWGYKVKGIKGDAEIIMCNNAFHGRSVTVLSGSDVAKYREGFGPFTPGFRIIPFGDADALERAITSNTVAFFVEPIQGEGGINVPPDGYLNNVSAICRKHNVLFVLDEIQTGLGRTGAKFAYWHECISYPDILILGKALGGGIVPISAVLTKSSEVMDVIGPGDHGSTFAGNPLACAVAIEALKVLDEERLTENALELGNYLMYRLNHMNNHRQIIEDVRGRGLFIGVEFRSGFGKIFCEKMLEAGVICKETRNDVVRLAPPLTITKDEIDMTLGRIKHVLGRDL